MTAVPYPPFRFKLGKTKARPGAAKLSFKKYADFSKLPAPPAEFGHDDLLPSYIGMLGNDNFGDCVWAGADHETMLWNAARGVHVNFNTHNALSDYHDATGFNPNDPNTDQGTDMVAAAAYRHKIGVISINGTRHKIGAYLSITPGDLQEHLVAAYVFETIGIGIQFPQSAMDQFNSGQPWDVVAGSPIEGGHYIPFLARKGGQTLIATWGARQFMTDAFFKQYNDESLVYVSNEMLSGGVSLEGFDIAQLVADLAALPGAA